MKIALLLILMLGMLGLKVKVAKGYLIFALSSVALALPLLAQATDLSNIWGEFQGFEYFPWVLFWVILPINFHFSKEFDLLHVLFQSAAVLIAVGHFGVYGLCVLEFLFCLYLLFKYKKLYKKLQIEYFFKFLLITTLIFQNEIVIFPDEIIINSIFIALIGYYFILSFTLDKNFFYLYLINLIIFANLLPENPWVSFNWVYLISTLVGLKYIHSNLAQLSLIPYLKKSLKALESIQLKFKLMLLKEGQLTYSSSEEIILQRQASGQPTEKKFSNDFSSSLFITLLIIFILVAFIVYRLD